MATVVQVVPDKEERRPHISDESVVLHSVGNLLRAMKAPEFRAEAMLLANDPSLRFRLVQAVLAEAEARDDVPFMHEIMNAARAAEASDINVNPELERVLDEIEIESRGA